MKQEQAIAEKLKKFALRHLEKAYQNELCELMRCQMTPEQEQTIQELWDIFEKEQKAYQNLLLKHDKSIEFERLLQIKKAELFYLKQLLMESLQAQI